MIHTPTYSILKKLVVDINILPKVLYIDNFKGNINIHKYNLYIVDSKNTKILNILKQEQKII